MAQAIGNFIDRIQIGNDDAHQIAIGSSAYGICNTNANESSKTVNIPGFILNTGTTVHIKFTYANTATTAPTLSINNSTAKPIVQYANIAVGTETNTSGWQAGAVLTLTYDGTSWVRDQGYNTDTSYSNVSTSAAGLVPQAPDDTTKFLRGDASWSVLPAASTEAAGIIQIGTGATNAAAGNHNHNEIYLTAVGYDSTNKKIYYTKNGSNTDVVTFGSNAFNSISYLPLGGGIMTGNIRRYYGSASTEPMITMLSNNLDIILWEAGHGSSAAATTTSNHYKLIYKGTGTDSNNSNYLQLVAHKTSDVVAVQIDEVGNVSLPQMDKGSATKPIYLNTNGVFTECTQLEDLAYVDFPSSNKTTTFLRGDGTWVTTITELTIETSSPLIGGSDTATTTTGTYTIGFSNQAHNTVLAGPSATDASNAAPTFRALVAADIPNLSAGKITSGTFAAARIPNLNASKITAGTFGVARGGTGQSSYTIGDMLYASATTTLSKLGANTTTTRKFLRSVATTADTPEAPEWDTLTEDDIPELSWSKITSGTPTTLEGYGITDAKIANDVITLGSNTIIPVTSVNGHRGSTVSVTAGDLGLSAALRFVGITTSDMSESFTGVPAGITSYTTPIVGDVVLDKNSDAEYVCIEVNTANNTATYTWELLGRSGSWALDNHVHGNITNTGLLSTENRMVITDANKAITTSGHYASATSLAINSTSPPDENLYVKGKIQFNIGTSDGASNKNFIIYGNSRALSIGAQGIQAYTTGTTVNTLYIQYTGGNIEVGQNNNACNNATRNMYGKFDFKSASGFTYSGMGTGTTDIARPIWFTAATNTTTLTTGRPVYANDFKYNPSTNTITIGTGTLSDTNYSGNAATATEWATAQNVKVILGTQYGNGTGQSETAINGGQTTVQTIAVDGVLKISNGGTGANSVNAYGVVYGNSSANAYDSISSDAEGQVFIGHGASGSTSAPSWYSGLLLTGAGTVASPYNAIFANDVSITGDLIVTATTKLTSNVGIGTDPDNNYLLYVDGETFFNDDTTINGDLIPTISSGNAAIQSLGTDTNLWASLFIDGTYGDEYTPIYWDDTNGKPATSIPLQYIEFTISQNNLGVTLASTAFTANSYVVQIVITDGESNLNSIITWTSSNGSIALTCDAVSGAVEGYILVARGGNIQSTITATQITPPSNT